jgi:predicted SprT family Zn-dependent metalloprotease
MDKKRIKYMKETILVFRDSTRNSQEIREDFSRVAWQNDWEPWNIQKKSENLQYIMTYMTRDEKTGINYLENDILEVFYIIIRGENQEKIAEILANKLDFYNIAELQNFIHSDPKDDKELARAIYLFAVSVEGESFNANHFATFEYCLTHSISNVRRAAMMAAGSVGWQEFQPILEKIRVEDPDLELRGYANTTLEAMQTCHWSPQSL